MSLVQPSTDSSTSPARKKVLVFRELPPDQLARLTAVHDVTVADPRKPDERALFDAALAEAQGLIGSSYPVDAALLARAPQLEVVSSVSEGVDNDALDALQARGIVLCHTPGVLDETVADAVFALLMATSRRVVELSQWVREGRWTKSIGEELFGTNVYGKTLGLLGFGRIGQAVAVIGQRAAGVDIHHGRGDGALLKFEIFDEGDGGFGVVVPIDHGDFEDVLRGIGLEVAIDVAGFGDALTGDDLSVDGFDDIDSSAISWEEEVVG